MLKMSVPGMRSELKEASLLLAFCFLMQEYLTVATMVFVCLGAALVVFRKRPGKHIRNGLALAIFGSYWWSYGKVIDPEVGLNFLTTVTVLKLMEKETLRDRFMLFFGLLLIISAGSLFEKTLSYVFFFIFSFFVLIQDFYQGIGARWKLGELMKAILWVAPITGFLFFLAPRAMNPLPFQQGQNEAGEVGYTPNVNLTQFEGLSANSTQVFEAQVSKKLLQHQLYWRGNAISFTDGWNWLAMNKAYPRVIAESEKIVPEDGEIIQSFRMNTREAYFFSLDSPTRALVGNKVYEIDKSKSFPQASHQWVSSYQIVSRPTVKFSDSDNPQSNLRAPIRKEYKEWVNRTFPGTTPQEVIEQVKDYFRKNGFTYSLTPGKITDFYQFMTANRTGFCAHYASALGLILRVKKIPARLVSGFMGGAYNHYAGFYEVYQNDAHVWVEVYQDGDWVRKDPTGWVAPERISEGGEAFMSSAKKGFNFMSQFGWYYDVRMWLGQWDFLVYQWLEETNYHSQEVWLKKFKVSRQWLYAIAILTALTFMLIYAWSVRRQVNKRLLSIEQQLWMEFREKTRARGLEMNIVSLKESRSVLSAFDHKDREILLQLWDRLVTFSFADVDPAQGRQLFSEIKRL